MKKKLVGIFLMLVLISTTCSGITNINNINNENDNYYIESNSITVQSHNIENIKTVSEYPFVYNYWTKIFNGGFFEEPDKYNYNEYVTEIVATEDGYIVWGNIINNPSNDFFMLKLNKQGYYEEFRCYDTGNDEFINEVIKVESWFILVGTYGAGYYDYALIIKINENLEVEWAKTYKLEDYGLGGYNIVSFRNGNNINYLFSANVGGWPDEYLIHIDAEGYYINSRKFTDPNIQLSLWFNDIKHFTSFGINYFIITGRVKNLLNDDERYVLLMKIREDLSPLWTKLYKLEDSSGGYFKEIGCCVKKTHDDGFILTGYGDTMSGGDVSGFFIIKTNEFGALEWSKAFFRYDWSFFGSRLVIKEISIKGSYEYILAGSMLSYEIPNIYDNCFIRFGINGNIINKHIFQLGLPLWDCNTEIPYHIVSPYIATKESMLILSDGVIIASITASFFHDTTADIFVSKIPFDGYIRDGCCMETFELEEYSGVWEVNENVEIWTPTVYYDIDEIKELINYENADVRSVDYCRSFGISAVVEWPISGSISFLKRKIMVPIFSPIALVVGPVVVEAEADSEEVEIDKVEFYIDDILMSVVTEEPYVWTWNKFEMGRNNLKIIAYNEVGDSTSDELDVWKFF